MVLLAILVLLLDQHKSVIILIGYVLLLKKNICFPYFDDTICDGLAVANGDIIKLQASVFIIE